MSDEVEDARKTIQRLERQLNTQNERVHSLEVELEDVYCPRQRVESDASQGAEREEAMLEQENWPLVGLLGQASRGWSSVPAMAVTAPAFDGTGGRVAKAPQALSSRLPAKKARSLSTTMKRRKSAAAGTTNLMTRYLTKPS